MFLVQYVAHHVILLLSNMHNRYCVWFMFFWYAFNEDFPHQMHLAIIPWSLTSFSGDTLQVPINPYGRSKKLAEEITLILIHSL
jgi:hypothetical protein